MEEKLPQPRSRDDFSRLREEIRETGPPGAGFVQPPDPLQPRKVTPPALCARTSARSRSPQSTRRDRKTGPASAAAPAPRTAPPAGPRRPPAAETPTSAP